jgi:hypothetical protein
MTFPKLSLNKETLRQLTDQDLHNAAAGMATGIVNGCDPSQYQTCTKWAGCTGYTTKNTGIDCF